MVLHLQVVPQADPNAVTYSSMIPQITAHVSAIQLGTPGSVSIRFPHFSVGNCDGIGVA